MNVSPGTRLHLYVVTQTEAEGAFLQSSAAVLQALAKLSEVKLFDNEAAWQAAAQSAPVAVVGEARVCLFVDHKNAGKKPAFCGRSDRHVSDGEAHG